MRVTYTIDKGKVLTEVRRLTAYAAQRKGEEGAFERMAATESDEGLLEQFWKSACAAATEQLKEYARMIDAGEDESGDGIATYRTDGIATYQAYEAVMEMPSLYDKKLNESIEGSLQGFFVNIIASKWFAWTDASGKAAETAAAEALVCMQDVERKIYHRKRPGRFTI